MALNKYRVTSTYTISVDVDVYAENESDAIDIAQDYYDRGYGMEEYMNNTVGIDNDDFQVHADGEMDFGYQPYIETIETNVPLEDVEVEADEELFECICETYGIDPDSLDDEDEEDY